MADLTDQEWMFVEEYLVDFNGRQAAIRAGYPATRPNANPGSRLLKKPAVKAAVESRLQQRAAQAQLTNERVLLEIARLAFNDPRRLFAENGALLPIADWPADCAAAVSAIKVQELKDADGAAYGLLKEIKFWDKGRQLDLAARHLGLLQDKLEISTPVAQLIRAARQRLKAEE